jgi:hypothetical protein
MKADLERKFVKDESEVDQVFYKNDKTRHRRKFAALQEKKTEALQNFEESDSVSDNDMNELDNIDKKIVDEKALLHKH